MAVFLSNTTGYSVLVVGDDDLARKLSSTFSASGAAASSSPATDQRASAS